MSSRENPNSVAIMSAEMPCARSTAGAVVHLHSCHSVALSVLPDANEDDFLPPLTAYGVMKLGRVKLLPFFLPGDPAMGEAIRGLAGRRSAVMLANHGPVVAGKDVEAACNAIEELEDTARLAMLTRGLHPRALTPDQVGTGEHTMFTLLVPAHSAQIIVNGQSLPGKIGQRVQAGYETTTAFLYFCETWVIPPEAS